MIVYNLICPDEHEFEAWFRDSAAFEDQCVRGAVRCPDCGSEEVRKAVMAPRVARQRAVDKTPPARMEAPPSPTAPSPEVVLAATAHREGLVKLMTELREHIESNCDYVGDRFAEEARRIHYGESQPRDIYGETTVAEARELIEEGVKVAPMPVLPRRNS